MDRDITDVFLQSLKPPVSGRLEIHDRRVIGLSLRVTPSGVCTWTVRSRLPDKRTRPSLGRWPELSIREARRRAQIVLGELVSGKDPVAEKRRARAERAVRAALPTVETRLTTWRAAKAADWSPRYAREVERLCVKIIVPKLGRRPLAEVTRGEMVAIITSEREQRPATATWLYQISSAFLNYAETCGWIDHPLLPRKGLSVIAPKVPPRQRVLSDTELAAVWHAAAHRSPRVRCFVHLLILTGCRVSEAAGIKAGELDFNQARWTIPGDRAKNGCAITLPLPGVLVTELTARTPPGAAPSHHLLGADKGAALQSISRIKACLDAASGVGAWRMHDIRRSCRTGLTRLGVSAEHAEAALNHIGSRSALERTYNRHDYTAEILRALSQWQDHVLEIVKPRLVAA